METTAHAPLERELSMPSYKVLLVGGSNVGKTCVLRRYVEGEFPLNSKATLGLDFKIRTLIKGQDEIRLQLWDTSGQERFRSMTQAYYRGSSGIVLCYDVTAEDSFTTLVDWLGDISTFAPEDVHVILLGNKCDVEEDERVVSLEAAEEFAKEHGLKHFETSAVTNQNVAEAFEYLASVLLESQTPKSTNGLNERLSDKMTSSGEGEAKKEGKFSCPC